MAAKKGKPYLNWLKGREQSLPDDPARPSIDLNMIKARYSARPLETDEETLEEDADIQFVDAESLTEHELEKELESQAETHIRGEETGFSEEALSLFEDEEDKPKRKHKKNRKIKKKKKAKKQKGKAHIDGGEQDGPELMDFSKPPREKIKIRRDVLGKLAVFSAIVFMVGILLILYYWLLISSIEVRGNETIERADVLSTAGINVGEHMLLANTGEARKKLLENPRVKDVIIKRVYPDKLIIDIKERMPAAAISGGNNYAIIDYDGYVLSIGPDNQELLEVYGMGSSGFQLGERLGESSDFNNSILLSMIKAMEKEGVLSDMAKLDITQPLNVNITTKDGYTILVGQAENLEEKFANLSIVLSKVKAMGYTGGSINLAVNGDPVYMPPLAEPMTLSPEDEPESPEQTQEPGQSPAINPDPSPSPAETPSQLPSVGGNNFSG